MKRVVALLAISLLLLPIAGMFQPSRPANAGPATTVWFEPSTMSVGVGQAFTLNVMIDTGVNSVSNAEIALAFDAGKLTAVEMKAGPFMSHVLVEPQLDNTTGRAVTMVDQGFPPSMKRTVGPELLATITFRAKAETRPTATLVRFSQEMKAYGETEGTLEPASVIVPSSFDNVARIVIGGAPGVLPPPVPPTLTPWPTPTPTPPSSGYQVIIPANQPWIDTGIQVPSYPAASFWWYLRAWGTIHTTTSDPGKGPDGDLNCIAPAGWVAPGLPCWSLVRKFGPNGTPFFTGSISRSGDMDPLQTPANLYFGVNDQVGSFFDNSGSWTANVEFNVDAYWPTPTPTPTATPWPTPTRMPPPPPPPPTPVPTPTPTTTPWPTATPTTWPTLAPTPTPTPTLPASVMLLYPTSTPGARLEVPTTTPTRIPTPTPARTPTPTPTPIRGGEVTTVEEGTRNGATFNLDPALITVIRWVWSHLTELLLFLVAISGLSLTLIWRWLQRPSLKIFNPHYPPSSGNQRTWHVQVTNEPSRLRAVMQLACVARSCQLEFRYYDYTSRTLVASHRGIWIEQPRSTQLDIAVGRTYSVPVITKRMSDGGAFVGDTPSSGQPQLPQGTFYVEIVVTPIEAKAAKGAFQLTNQGIDFTNFKLEPTAK